MYKIGDFSKMSMVTIKALRYYDEIGLLKPCQIDEFTGYRYYSANQLDDLHQILNLKQMGCTINEIQSVLNNELDVKLLLENKINEIKENICNDRTKIRNIKSYLKLNSGGNVNMKYEAVIKSLPKVIVASKRKVIKGYDDFFTLMPKMGEEMGKAGCVCAEPEYCFNIYHDHGYKETDIDVEMCEAVTEMKPSTETLKFKEIAEVPTAICFMHKGPYNKLGEAYEFAMKWIEENGYEIVDNLRESYIDGIWNKDSEEQWLTEIQVPARKK